MRAILNKNHKSMIDFMTNLQKDYSIYNFNKFKL